MPQANAGAAPVPVHVFAFTSSQWKSVDPLMHNLQSPVHALENGIWLSRHPSNDPSNRLTGWPLQFWLRHCRSQSWTWAIPIPAKIPKDISTTNVAPIIIPRIELSNCQGSQTRSRPAGGRPLLINLHNAVNCPVETVEHWQIFRMGHMPRRQCLQR